MKLVATFHNHYAATVFFAHCKARGIEAKMAPTPRRLSVSCGSCVIFDIGHEIDYNKFDAEGVYDAQSYVKIWHSEE